MSMMTQAPSSNTACSKSSTAQGTHPSKLRGDALLKKHPDGVVIDNEIRRAIAQSARYRQMPLFIHGETGTGKEEAVKILYRESTQLYGPMPLIIVNCSHMRGDLTRSELFGHKKGAFSGASEMNLGMIARANGGILFLDELQALPMECQRDLLRVLNDGTFQRLGDSTLHHSSFKLVIASTRSLEDLASEGSLLLDLASRITGFSLHLKPLRERPEELAALVEVFFLRQKLHVTPLALRGLIEKCLGYYWQGNMRLLVRALEVMVAQADFAAEPYGPLFLPDLELMKAPRGSTHEQNPLTASLLNHLLDQAVNGEITLQQALEGFEAEILKKTISTSPTIAAAAHRLRVPRTTLDWKRKRAGLTMKKRPERPRTRTLTSNNQLKNKTKITLI